MVDSNNFGHGMALSVSGRSNVNSASELSSI
jgi:hypothetical protein